MSKEGQSQLPIENDDSLSCGGEFVEKQSGEDEINLSECNEIREKASENTRIASYPQENLHLNSQSDYEDCLKEDQTLLPADIDQTDSLDWETDATNYKNDDSSSDDSSDHSASEMSSESIADEIEASVGGNKEDFCDNLYQKYHRRLDHLLPSHLPGRPKSFEAYLQSVYPQLSKFDVERANIQSSAGSTPVYKDARIRSFIASCFPAIKVGSFVSARDGFSFEGDVFPQFSQIGKGNFACQICIPYLKWAILNSHPHAAARSKQASTDAILNDTATLEFSGIVQVREHSLSKCHVEAKHFWQRERVEENKADHPSNKEKGKKTKLISDFFKKTANPLN